MAGRQCATKHHCAHTHKRSSNPLKLVMDVRCRRDQNSSPATQQPSSPAIGFICCQLTAKHAYDALHRCIADCSTHWEVCASVRVCVFDWAWLGVAFKCRLARPKVQRRDASSNSTTIARRTPAVCQLRAALGAAHRLLADATFHVIFALICV